MRNLQPERIIYSTCLINLVQYVQVPFFGVLLLSTEQGDDNPEAHIENAGKNIC